MKEFLEAKKILNDNYKDIMAAFSSICTQLELPSCGLKSEEISAKAAYYTVVWRYLKGVPPLVSNIETLIRKNKDMQLKSTDTELAIVILTENKIHQLEREGLIPVTKAKDGMSILELTSKGKAASLKNGHDIRGY